MVPGERADLRNPENGEPVFVPIPGALTQQDCPYYFWTGVALRRAAVAIAERTLAAVFKQSVLKNPTPNGAATLWRRGF